MNSWARINFWADSVIPLSTHSPEEERVGLGVSIRQTCPFIHWVLAWALSGTASPPLSGASSFAVTQGMTRAPLSWGHQPSPGSWALGGWTAASKGIRPWFLEPVNVALFEKRFFVGISYSHPLSMAFRGYSVHMCWLIIDGTLRERPFPPENIHKRINGPRGSACFMRRKPDLQAVFLLSYGCSIQLFTEKRQGG